MKTQYEDRRNTNTVVINRALDIFRQEFIDDENKKRRELKKIEAHIKMSNGQ